MACERFEKALIEEAIVPGGDAELAAHLANCPECSEELARQRELQDRITRGVAAIVAGGPSQGLLVRVRQQIAAEQAPRLFPWTQWAAIGFAMVTCAALAIWYAGHWHETGGQRQAQTVQVPTQVPPTLQAPSQQAPQQLPAAVASVVKPRRNGANQVVAVHKSSPTSIHTAVAEKNPPQGPEVIVPPGQREAVFRLVNALQTGRVDAASLMQPAQTGDYALLKIVPIEVKPLGAEASKEDPGKQGNQDDH